MLRCIHGRAPPNELRVALVRARGLLGIDRGLSAAHSRPSDLVGRISIISSCGSIMDTVESGVAQTCLNPVWNAVFSFELQHTEVQDSGASPTLEITIRDWAALSSNDVLGCAIVPLSPLRSKLRNRQWIQLQDNEFANKPSKLQK